jgi:N6-adenosine-specific RNA methylase IME4
MMAAWWKNENKLEPATRPRNDEGQFIPSEARASDGMTSGGRPTETLACRDFNVTKAGVDKATYVNTKDLKLAKRVHSGEIALNNAYRQVKLQQEREKINNTKPPEGIYQVVVLDPPWPYANRQSDPTHEIGSPYQTMTIAELEQLVVPATDDSILWLWTTNAFLHEAFHLLEKWGFAYRTTLTWAKNSIGLGDWLGGQTEHCLLATRGAYRFLRNNEGTLLNAARTKHSEKPKEFYTMVEGLCPGERLDMFARCNREGWACWGAELTDNEQLE